MPETTVKIILAHNELTKWMRILDVFEPSKAVMCSEMIRVTYKKSPTKKQITLLTNFLSEQGHDIIAIFNSAKVYYKNPAIHSISDGTRWGLLDEYIQYEMNK